MNESVVFLPGLMCDARLFGPQIAALSGTHPVMALPLSSAERIEEFASAALDVLPQRFALVGHGLGGVTALEILRRAPDRVSRIALISTTPLPETPQQAAAREPRLIRARAGRLAEVMQEELADTVPGNHPARAEILHLANDMALGLGAEVYGRQCRALQRRRDQQPTLRRIVVPTLVLCGEEDQAVPVKRHAFMAELIHGAQLRVLPGVGHLPPLEAPEEVIAALRDWLAQPLVLR